MYGVFPRIFLSPFKAKAFYVRIHWLFLKETVLYIFTVLPGTIRFEPNCRMQSIFMDSMNRKRRKTYPKKNNQQIFPFWIICFELTIVGNSKQIIKKEKMEHNILKSLQPLFNQGLESYDLHNYSLIHMPIPSSFSLLTAVVICRLHC